MATRHEIDTHSSTRTRWVAVALAVAAPAPIQGLAQVAPTDLAFVPTGQWLYSASIYAYVPTLGGSSSFPADSGGTSLNLSADQILDKLKVFAMATFGAHNGTWGVFTDVIYLNFDGSQSNSRDFTIGN